MKWCKEKRERKKRWAGRGKKTFPTEAIRAGVASLPLCNDSIHRRWIVKRSAPSRRLQITSSRECGVMTCLPGRRWCDDAPPRSDETPLVASGVMISLLERRRCDNLINLILSRCDDVPLMPFELWDRSLCDDLPPGASVMWWVDSTVWWKAF